MLDGLLRLSLTRLTNRTLKRMLRERGCAHNAANFEMAKDTQFVVKFNSRCDARLFCNLAKKELKKERSHEGFTEHDHTHCWISGSGTMVTVFLFFSKTPLTLDEVKGFSLAVTLGGNCFLLLAQLMIH